MRRPLKNSTEPKADTSMEELTSLARLVLFAGQTARDLGVDFPAYLLDLAHGAVVQEIQDKFGPIPPSWWEENTLNGKSIN
ncbi:hypothetical protein [Aliirhizobium smilacinae]|uniref:Uncharacterized protein n=1 Tax=Aliirhizobium smilacinae TaxID=1395944 RepID=A0A5C4XS23_9HYPH|nr:hypothetical protein [Rhizobium smilacinae]TNM65360.1 hypothetical protein FHP24_03545 [Rhizobium smilacinae]